MSVGEAVLHSCYIRSRCCCGGVCRQGTRGQGAPRQRRRLRADAVAYGAQSVHPSGSPISCSVNEGDSPAVAEVFTPAGDVVGSGQSRESASRSRLTSSSRFPVRVRPRAAMCLRIDAGGRRLILQEAEAARGVGHKVEPLPLVARACLLRREESCFHAETHAFQVADDVA